jgi:hypothetical protein
MGLRAFLRLTGKEVAEANKWRADLGSSTNLASENLGERNLPIQHLDKVKAIHADEALTPPEGKETVIGEAAIAYEEAPGPRRFLLKLPVEGVQFGDTDSLILPFGFEQVDVASKLEAAVDLFALKAK